MTRNFISQKVDSLSPSGLARYFRIAATIQDVISLGIGEPDFTTPPEIVQAGIDSLARGETHYAEMAGIEPLRQGVAARLKRLYGVEYNPVCELLITVGVSEALLIVMTAILDPGDEVIVPQPCFNAYPACVQLNNGVAVPVYCQVEDRFQVTAEEIEAKITPRTKALLIGYPNNPTGAVLERDTMLEIARVAEKHDLLVISDEIYDRLVYAGEHTCFASLPGMRSRTVLLGGFSKNYAMTGWRIGYLAAPESLCSAVAKVHQFTIMSVPTMSQAAALEALASGDAAVEAMRQEYDRRRRLMVNGLNDLGLACFEPQGAFYAFPSVTATGLNDEQFADALLKEERVACAPGSVFGEPTRQYVRMSYATAYEKLEQALERMRRFMKNHG